MINSKFLDSIEDNVASAVIDVQEGNQHLVKAREYQVFDLRYKILKYVINPQAPVAQKVTDEVIFRRSQGEGVEVFLIGPH